MEVLPVGIDWFRDLVICVFGLVATGVFILIAVLLFLLYRRVRAILDSVKATSRTIQDVTSYVGDEVVNHLGHMEEGVDGSNSYEGSKVLYLDDFAFNNFLHLRMVREECEGHCVIGRSIARDHSANGRHFHVRNSHHEAKFIIHYALKLTTQFFVGHDF